MRSLWCGRCRKPVPPHQHHVLLRLYTERGRPVVVRLHEGCAVGTQGAISMQSRVNEVAIREMIERARQYRARRGWYADDIRLLRRMLGLTQAELAAQLGCARQSVFNHERRNAAPWKRMAGVLGLLEAEAVRQTGLGPEEYRIETRNR